MIAVFAGPTISSEEIHASLPAATVLPPVSLGDVYRIAQSAPDAIAIIDGYFDRVPAVWHKEILWALSRGIPVLGSSSMGALRAAELADFGMVGIGAVFKSFRCGELEDDDEVAVWHSDAGNSYRALTEAMVDIRATLTRALDDSVISEDQRSSAIAAAKMLYYKERTYSRVLQALSACGWQFDVLERLRNWLRTNKVSQKHLDALDLMAALRSNDFAGQARRPAFQFQHTTMWETLRLSCRAELPWAKASSGGAPCTELIEEMRKTPQLFDGTMNMALLRFLALREARNQGVAPSRKSIQACLDDFRRRHNLLREEQLRDWCIRNALSFPDDLESLITEEATIVDLFARSRDAIERFIPNTLRAAGQFETVYSKAQSRSEMLSAPYANIE
jgi:hypothetical protein